MSLPRITMDFESRSKCNLKTAGAYIYSLDPSTRPTCLAFKERGDDRVYLIRFDSIARPWKELPEAFRKKWSGWIKEGREFSAHNAFFERCIYTNIMVKRYGWPVIPAELYRCTAAKAAAHALPRNLAGAGEALKLVVQKDFRGYQAMMATCKPTKQWNAWTKARAEIAAGKKVGAKKHMLAAQPEPPVFLEPHQAPETWETLYTYCKIDVKAEEEIDVTLPDLNPVEQKIWHLNQKLNWRGVRVDIPTAKKIVAIMSEESQTKLKELDALTMGLVTKPGARKSILEFLALEEVILPDLKAKTVEDFLKSGDLSEDMQRLLEIRKALSKTSTRKYLAMIERADSDHRIRDIQMYHGASTGRDTGTGGVQVHNFPKPIIRIEKGRPYAAIENVIECEADMLRFLYGDSLGILFSSILRNMIMASEGSELFVADYSKIEVAVLWWLAGNEPGLAVLRSGKDPYIYQAAANKGVRYDDIDKDGDDRQLGKAQVLGCGFGMGPDKFQATAWDFYRLKLSAAESRSAVYGYRNSNPTVPQMWKNVERAAIMAVETPGRTIKVNRCRFVFKDSFLWIELPSGRKLAYRDPQITWRQTDYGSQKTLEFWAVYSKTKKWSLERTWGGSLTENIVQAVARDFMMQGTLALEEAGYKIIMTVHDEVVTERDKGRGSMEEFLKLFCRLPAWGNGMPLVANGWTGATRYRK